jgi:hypothetical protein
VSPARSRAGTLGPFFDVEEHPAGAVPVPPWRVLSELTVPGEALSDRIEAVQRALAARSGDPAAAVPLRVAASVCHLGLVARLIAPFLAATALRGPGHLDLRPAGVWWKNQLGGPVPLSVPGSGADHGLIDDVVDPLTAAVGDLAPVSPRVLWGNVASAINSAAALIAGQRPDLAPAAWAAARDLAGHPRLGGERVPLGPGFRRSSCCLIYRLAAPGTQKAVCGDCVLAQGTVGP